MVNNQTRYIVVRNIYQYFFGRPFRGGFYSFGRSIKSIGSNVHNWVCLTMFLKGGVALWHTKACSLYLMACRHKDMG